MSSESKGEIVRRPKVGMRSAVWLKSGVDAFGTVLDLAVDAERRGFDAVFFGDRMLAEVGEGDRGVYNSTHTEIFTTLAAIAARTERIQLGSLVLVVPFRHPVPLAKTIASVDLLSRGRLLLGVGTGWNPTEFEVMGVSKREAPAILEESVTLMKQLWTGEPITFDGQFNQLTGIAVEPTPHREGGPPIWLGGFSPLQTSIWEDQITGSAERGLERIGRMADTWIPLLYSTKYGRSIGSRTLADAFDIINRSAEDAERGSDAVSFAFSHWYYVIENKKDEEEARRDLAFFFPGTFEEAKETYLIGSPEEIVDKIHRICADIADPEWYVFTQLGNNERQLDLLDEVVLPKLGIQR